MAIVFNISIEDIFWYII